MKRILGIFIMILSALQCVAQTEYISNSREVDADRIENLSGKYGLLLLSKHKDLVINVVNASQKPEIKFEGQNKSGYYEYQVVLDANDAHNAKVEVSRRGNVYKTEFVQTLKPDYLIAYRIEELQNPIRIENQTRGNDTRMNANEAELEFTSSVQNLTVKCSDKLGAKITSTVSKSDNNITIISVVFPVEAINAAKKRVGRRSKQIQ